MCDTRFVISKVKENRFYQTLDGQTPFTRWFEKLKDARAKVASAGDKDTQKKDIAFCESVLARLQAEKTMKPKARTRKPAPSVPAEPFLQAQLKDPEYAVEYIRQALEDDDLTFMLLSLRNVAEACGGLGKLAKKAGLNRTQVYEILSEKGNPSLPKLKSILKALGFELTVKRAA